MPGKAMIILSFILFFAIVARAQLLTPYVISNFSFSDSLSTGQNNYSYLDSGKCLISSSGVVLYFAQQNKSKTFNPVCPEDVPGQNICPLVGYPNPTSGIVTLKSGICYNQYNFLKGILSVTDVYGTTLIKEDIFLNDIRSGFRIDLKPYAQGVFFFRLYFLNNTTVIKILKNTSASDF